MLHLISLSKIHPSIRFMIEHEDDNKLHFLDITIQP